MMNKFYFLLVAFAVAFLFFIQLAGSLVESIYILNLLNTALDARALGLLFFFSPVILLFFRGKPPAWLIWVIFALLFLSRGMLPYQDTNGRLWVSGLGTSAVILLIPILLTATPKGHIPSGSGMVASAGLALGTALSVLFRTFNSSIDYSLTSSGSWLGWALGLLLGIALSQLEWSRLATSKGVKKGMASAVLGLFLALTLVYFVFSAPAVLARWTAGPYPLIVSLTSLAALGWVAVVVDRPGWFNSGSPRLLLVWNLLFMAALLGTIGVHQVPFPQSPGAAPVVINPPTLLQLIPLLMMLLLYPVLFLNVRFFAGAIQQMAPAPRDFVPGMILGSFGLVLLVFMLIFTNVWGYVEPVSPFFRGKFWLPFALITAFLTVLGVMFASWKPAAFHQGSKSHQAGWTFALLVLFLLTVGFSLPKAPAEPISAAPDSLLVMTYNIQQGNDHTGERAYQRQLALIQQISPDVLALQESDSARISLNNNDYVRYFASRLGYYNYYGPTTVSGTFGTAVLSRYPLVDPYTIFSYSDQDEVGTAVAALKIADQTFTIYNVHPDGSDTAMLAFAEALLADAGDRQGVIALGDYNLREDESPYQRIDAAFTNAWTSVYPGGVSDDGVDMSGAKRIDHIFLSPDLKAQDPVYLLPPESHTDHPAHWAWILWER